MGEATLSTCQSLDLFVLTYKVRKKFRRDDEKLQNKRFVAIAGALLFLLVQVPVAASQANETSVTEHPSLHSNESQLGVSNNAIPPHLLGDSNPEFRNIAASSADEFSEVSMNYKKETSAWDTASTEEAWTAPLAANNSPGTGEDADVVNETTMLQLETRQDPLFQAQLDQEEDRNTSSLQEPETTLDMKDEEGWLGEENEEDLWTNDLARLIEEESEEHLMLSREKRQEPRDVNYIEDGSTGPPLRENITFLCVCQQCNSSGAEGIYWKGTEYENVAYARGGKISSRAGYAGGRSFDGCMATNGLIFPWFGGSNLVNPNCFQTDYEEVIHYFHCPMKQPITVKLIEIFGHWNSLFFPDRLKKSKFYLDWSFCFKAPLFTMSHSYFFNCTRPLRGTMLKMEKYPKYDSFWHFPMSLCEIQLWVCRPGTYGKYPSGCYICPQKCKYTCDNYYGCDTEVIYDIAVNMEITASDRHSGDITYLVYGAYIFYTADQFCFLTETSSSYSHVHWFKLSLVYSYLIYRLYIYGRHECCSMDELRAFYVVVTNTSRIPSYPPTGKMVCNYRSGGVVTASYGHIPCRSPRVGRWVTIMKKGRTRLSACEVTIYGRLRYVLSPEAPCTEGGQSLVCRREYICGGGHCKVRVGFSCTTTDQCVPGSNCTRRICRHPPAAKCDRRKTYCDTGWICDPDTNYECKRDFGYMCNRTYSLCRGAAICDLFHYCSRPVNASCNDTLECIPGARCIEHKCVCIPEITYPKGRECEPRKGRVKTPCDPIELPEKQGCVTENCTNGICECRTGESPYRVTLYCKRSVGSPCEYTSDCNVGLVCEEKQCRIPIGKACEVADLCVRAAMCEDNECKIKVGENCPSTEELCIRRAECSRGKCRISITGYCADYPKFCIKGACHAVDGHTCTLSPEEECEYGLPGLKKACTAGTICTAEGFCKIKAGELCERTSQCASVLVCDARKESPEKRCRNLLGSVECTGDNDCESISICDLHHRCKLPVNHECVNYRKQCLSGAVCKEKKCQCNPAVSNVSTERCEPLVGKAGGNCSSDPDDECHESALCTNGICHCISPLTLNAENLTCEGLEPGEPCQKNTTGTFGCAYASLCESRVCIREVGQLCIGGKKTVSCQKGSECYKKGYCLVSHHRNCTGLEHFCVPSTVCDFLKQCKFRPGHDCDADRDCVVAALCNNDTCECNEEVSVQKNDSCEIKDGFTLGKCSSATPCKDKLAVCNKKTGLCECKPGYVVNPPTLTCAKDVGEPCKKDEECLVELICDKEYKQCKVKLGDLCPGKREKHCQSGTNCDFDSVCRLKLKQDCSGPRATYCISGLFCDWLGFCGVGVGDSCYDDKTSCVAGAKCENKSVCFCDPDISSTYGAICEPHKGRIGGRCDVEGSACEVASSVCSHGRCSCTRDLEPTQRFACETGVRVLHQNLIDGTAMILVILGVLLLLIFLLLLLLALRRRRRQKKKEVVEEAHQKWGATGEKMAEIKQNIDDLPSDLRGPMSEDRRSPSRGRSRSGQQSDEDGQAPEPAGENELEAGAGAEAGTGEEAGEEPADAGLTLTPPEPEEEFKPLIPIPMI